MMTIAKFPAAAEAQTALDLLKARGIPGVIVPDEAPAGMWKGGERELLGFRLDVEDDRSREAWSALKDLGFNVIEA